MAGLYMLQRTFAREVGDLEPPWGGTRRSIVRVLRVMDEAGALKPILRLYLPKDYARYDFQYPRVDEDAFTSRQVEEFHALRNALVELETPTTDALREQIESDDSVLAPYVGRPDEGESVRWDDWMIPVDTNEGGRTVSRPHVLSVYGAWQTIECWMAIEKFSVRILIDPREMHPRDILGASWELGPGRGTLKWTTGNPRAKRVFQESNAGGWLRRLYRFREHVRLGRLRFRRPHLTGWETGDELSDGERREAVNEWLRGRAKEVAGRWTEDADDFFARMTGLLKMVEHAENLHSSELIDLLHRDLWTAVDWAAHLYDLDLHQLDKRVEPAGPHYQKTLYAELRPTWHEARRSSERYLTQFVDDENVHPSLSLTESSRDALLDFLFEEGIEAWALELSELQDEFADPTDASLDRRFLHLRSMALLTEVLIGRLAERFGTDRDRRQIESWTTKSSFQTFLVERSGWRGTICQCLGERWEDFTQANDVEGFAENVEQMFDETMPLCQRRPQLDPIVRVLFTTGALRNYGAHGFTRERGLLIHRLGHLMGSVAQTVVFYWNLTREGD